MVSKRLLCSAVILLFASFPRAVSGAMSLVSSAQWPFSNGQDDGVLAAPSLVWPKFETTFLWSCGALDEFVYGQSAVGLLELLVVPGSCVVVSRCNGGDFRVPEVLVVPDVKQSASQLVSSNVLMGDEFWGVYLSAAIAAAFCFAATAVAACYQSSSISGKGKRFCKGMERLRRKDGSATRSLQACFTLAEFSFPKLGSALSLGWMEALRQLGGCIFVVSSAASQAVVTAAASDFSFSLGGFLTLVEPCVVSVVVTRSAAAAQKYGIPLVCLFLVSFTGVLSAFLAGHFHGILVSSRFLEPALSSIGHVLGLRIWGAAHGASLVSCDRLVRSLLALVTSTTSPSGAQQVAAALSKLTVWSRCLRSRFAFAKAKASPRVDVDETSLSAAADVQQKGSFLIRGPESFQVFVHIAGSGTRVLWVTPCTTLSDLCGIAGLDCVENEMGAMSVRR